MLRVGPGSALFMVVVFTLEVACLAYLARRQRRGGLPAIATWVPVVIGCGTVARGVAHLNHWPHQAMAALDLVNLAIAIPVFGLALRDVVRRSYEHANSATGDGLDDLLGGQPRDDESGEPEQ